MKLRFEKTEDSDEYGIEMQFISIDEEYRKNVSSSVTGSDGNTYSLASMSTPVLTEWTLFIYGEAKDNDKSITSYYWGNKNKRDVAYDAFTKCLNRIDAEIIISSIIEKKVEPVVKVSIQPKKRISKEKMLKELSNLI